MGTRCEKCGAPVDAEQAFCPRCGAVVGMAAAAPGGDEGWDLPTTAVGRKPPPARSTRPSAGRTPATVRVDAAQARPRAGGKTLLLAVIVFVAVLLIGGLLVMLYLNSQA